MSNVLLLTLFHILRSYHFYMERLLDYFLCFLLPLVVVEIFVFVFDQFLADYIELLINFRVWLYIIVKVFMWELSSRILFLLLSQRKYFPVSFVSCYYQFQFKSNRHVFPKNVELSSSRIFSFFFKYMIYTRSHI